MTSGHTADSVLIMPQRIPHRSLTDPVPSARFRAPNVREGPNSQASDDFFGFMTAGHTGFTGIVRMIPAGV
jgi:hypothetical protein